MSSAPPRWDGATGERFSAISACRLGSTTWPVRSRCRILNQCMFGQAKLTAGSDVLVDPSADFTKLDLKQVSNLHVHWGGQYAGVDAGRFPVGEGDPNAGVYEVVEMLDKNRLRIRPAPANSGALGLLAGKNVLLDAFGSATLSSICWIPVRCATCRTRRTRTRRAPRCSDAASANG